MDLSVAVLDVVTYAGTTLTGFGAIIALAIGVRLAIRAAKSFGARG
jgi:hypothetical protein